MNFLIIAEYDCVEWFCILGRTYYVRLLWKIDENIDKENRENEGSQNICVDPLLLFFFEWLVCRVGLRIDDKGMRNRIKIERGEKFEEISFLLGGIVSN